LKLQYLRSACVLIEHEETRILCDPWLVDGEYYGSWYHYPPLAINPEDFNNVDYIYISHIHPDHFSPKTLTRMNKSIPILILDYKEKFLRENIKRLGFEVRELFHNQKTPIGNLNITIFASDNCDPELCTKFFGCASMNIDSLSLIDDGKHVVVNNNDCPYPMAGVVSKKIKEQNSVIDLLLVGYGGAGPYPQCFTLTKKQMKKAVDWKKNHFLEQADKYIKLFNPKKFMPFAGRYELAGKFHTLNEDRGLPTLDESREYFDDPRCMIMNPTGWYDIDKNVVMQDYVAENEIDKDNYIHNILVTEKMDYEFDKLPTRKDFLDLIPDSFNRFEETRKKVGYTTKNLIILKILDAYLLIRADGSNRICFVDDIDGLDNFILLEMNPRLLLRILKGPRYAHWNNAEIGSHIHYTRKPDTFDRTLFYCMNFFHS